MTELDDLRGRIEWLEDRAVAEDGSSDPTLDIYRLRNDVTRRRADVERGVRGRLVTRTHKRTERSPVFTGLNHEELRRWAAGRCSLPNESGSMRLIWHGEEHGLLRHGDWVNVDPDTQRMTIGRPSPTDDFDPVELYREVSPS